MAGAAPRSPALLAVLTVAVALLGGAIIAEVALRIAGFEPFRYSTLDRDEPVMNQPDPVRGWRNRPGVYRIPAYSSEGHETTIEIRGDGGRRTGDADSLGRPGLVMVGGSFTRGNGLSDEDTVAWKLQERFPSLHVANYGTGGYGTYQSLLTLEEVLPQSRASFVVYGFIDHHEMRNVALPSWIDLLSRFARRRQVAVPHCTLDALGGLRRADPLRYPMFPLHELLASVAFIEHWIAYSGGGERAAQARPVTERLLVSMRDLAARHDARFVAMLLTATPEARTHYRRYLAREGVVVADCARAVTPDLQVRGEGHPNAILNAWWADCIAGVLAPLVAERRQSEG